MKCLKQAVVRNDSIFSGSEHIRACGFVRS